MSIRKLFVPVRRPSFIVLDSTLNEFQANGSKLILNNFTISYLVFLWIITVVCFVIVVLSYLFMVGHGVVHGGHQVSRTMNLYRMCIALLFFLIHIFILIRRFYTKKRMRLLNPRLENAVYVGNVKVNDLSVEFSSKPKQMFLLKTDQGNTTIQASNLFSFMYFKNFVNK